ncbi:MAG: hypothetical protein K6C12_11830 [Oscillospiraceae bacterium]|nr:hypothetical protein [Oscillospiraceae bacterium]
MDLSNISIDQLGLSRRSKNALHRGSINNAAQLIELTWEQIFGLRNVGQKSVEEIMLKIGELKENPAAFMENAETGERTDSSEENVLRRLREHPVSIGELSMLPTQVYNLLFFSGYRSLEQIVFLGINELMQIPGMTRGAAEEIAEQCRRYLEEHTDEFQNEDERTEMPDLSIFEAIHLPQYHDLILSNAREIDVELTRIPMSARAHNGLNASGYRMMSDIIFLNEQDLQKTRALGTKTIRIITEAVRKYLTENESRLLPGGADAAAEAQRIDDERLRTMIPGLWQEHGFVGYSLKEMRDALQLPEQVEEERLKKVIGALLAAGELEYVDFRCYRVYEKFTDELDRAEGINERSREILRKRLEGRTLDEIGKEYDLTRERVRQIIAKTARKVRRWHADATGKEYFDEDYYRYFCETYSFERKDATEWLGIPESVFRYLDMMDAGKGRKDLREALEDVRGLDAGLRLKIKNYLNRNRVFIDGVWVEKTRSELERIAVKKICRDAMPFRDFVSQYNGFLKERDIEDEDLLITEAVIRTRLGRIREERCVLWSLGGKLRYYDIDGRDYQELYDTLDLNSFENIEISTKKLFREYPELMRKYDIRDHYELHNLLRKTVKDGDFHEFLCCDMPNIRFGSFNMDSAMWELIVENAPIRVTELAEIVSDMYGFEPGITTGTYLKPFSAYLHQGVYTVDQKPMATEHRMQLQAALTEDFYYLDEIRRIYAGLYPEADLNEINTYNLKQMGFTVLSRYAFQHYPSLDAYYRDILTRSDFLDITPYKKRYTGAVFYQTFQSLRENLDLIEFEPNQFIHIRQLQKSGITKENLQEFCDDVWNCAENGTFFSIRSLRKAGFDSELFDLGFEDLFYAAVLQSDERFSSGQVYGTTVFLKDRKNVTIRGLIESLVKEQKSMDMLDLLTVLQEEFGCHPENRSDILGKITESDLYYDGTLDRLYTSSEAFYRELDEAEGSR